jgi:hypothetical protein
MDWHFSQRHDEFFYTRVNRDSLQDTIRLTNVIDGGSVTQNALSALKTSASVDYFDVLDIGNDYLRIYSTSRVGGQETTIAHGTFLVSTPQTKQTDTKRSGTAKLYSLLQLLQRKKIGLPLTLPAGTNATEYVAEMVRAVGLNTVSDGAVATLNISKTYDFGMTHLEIINDLLVFAGCRSLGIDGWGNVLIQKSRDLSEITPSVHFTEGQGSVFLPETLYTFDDFEVPNRLQVTCSRPDQPPMIAIAVNSDPNNRYSTQSRGDVIDAEPEEVDDITSQQALEELAKMRLLAKTSAVESVEVTHSYMPFALDDGCRIRHGEMDFTGVIVSFETKLTPGMTTHTRVRRFVRF